MRKILVTGAAGFLGWHMTTYLKKKGHFVRGVDIVEPKYLKSQADEFLLCDLRDTSQMSELLNDIEWVFHFASDIGGSPYVHKNQANILKNNTEIDMHLLDFCFKNLSKSLRIIIPSDVGVESVGASKANSESPHLMSKMVTERLANLYHKECYLDTRIVRLHNVYGPLCPLNDEKEKSIAGLCRKILLDKDTVEIFGNGKNVRCFLYIDDAIEGIYQAAKLENNKIEIELPGKEIVSIDQIVDKLLVISKKQHLKKTYVKSDWSELTIPSPTYDTAKTFLNWEPKVGIDEGLIKTFNWVAVQDY